MKHRNSHFAVGYWSRIRKSRSVPDQADIDPRALKSLLPYVFLLDARAPKSPVYRLAGTTLCERFGHELRGRGFLSHWDPESRARLADGIADALAQKMPLCIRSIGATDDCGMAEFETLLMPLSFGSETPERFLGVAQLVSDVAPILGRCIRFERLTGISLVRDNEGIAPAETPRTPPPERRPAGRPFLRLVSSD